MAWMLEENGRGAVMERSEACNAGRSGELKNTKLGAEEESEQEREEEAGGGDLLPEMDWAEPLRSGPRLGSGLLRIGGRGRTRKQQPEQPAE